MSQIAAAVLGNNIGNNASPPGIVPERSKHLKRYAFAFLVDISGSTGVGPDPDINHINDAINKLFNTLLNPPANSELARQIIQVDVCLITYSNAPDIIIPWSVQKDLPASIQPFKPQQGTATGKALEHALAYIGTRQRYYKKTENNIPSGMPHIIHLTDGAPTDMTIGSPRWADVQARLSKLGGTINPEHQKAHILHFVSPNGCVAGSPSGTMKDEHGQDITGQQALAKLSGANTVYALGSEVASFHALVKMITAIISKVTLDFGTEEAAERASKQVNEHIKKTENE
jgi:uncharacterized protein YegL